MTIRVEPGFSVAAKGERPKPPERLNGARLLLEPGLGAPSRPALLSYAVDAPAAGPRAAWSYAALAGAALALGERLRAAGVRPGDRVMIGLGDSAVFPIAYLAVIGVGAVATPLAAGLSAEELRRIEADCDPALRLYDAAMTAKAGPGAPIWEGAALAADAAAAAEADLAALGALADTAAEDPAFLVYTSGATGRPKGVLHAHRAIFARRMMREDWLGLRPDDRMLHAGAFNWTYTLGVGLMDPWAVGATAMTAIATEAGDKPPAAWPALIEASGATLFAATPAHYRRLLKYGRLDRAPHWALRHALSAGEKLPDALRRAWTAASGRPLYEAMGLSECSTFLSFGPTEPPEDGLVGKPQSGRRVAVLALEPEDAGEPAPLGAVGRLAVDARDPGLTLGYWRDAAATAQARRGDWFMTGDLARMTASGAIAYEGRSDDQMNAAGFRVAPEEVEAALALDPDVADCAAATVRTPDGVELIAAFIAPTRPNASAEAILARAAERLADYKRPRHVAFVEVVPRTANGKLKRRELGAQETARLADAAAGRTAR